MKDSLPDNYVQYHELNRGRRLKILEKLNSDNPKLNVYLFIATCATTFLSGWLHNGYWQAGAWHSTAIISILFAHEMGHYLMCKKYGIRATLPFFIPFPLPFLNPFGTMGAVIKMEARIPSRQALFDVAVAGPLAGLIVTIPCIYFGIQLSEKVTVTPEMMTGAITLGESFLFAKISNLAIGAIPEGQDVMLHPLAFAGWAGLFVTALNLLPIGQLDGGHIVYALIGKRHKLVASLTLIIFGAICIFIYQGWFL
ncbi:site-2 protease family protein, partial [bacterium]|nr:site-2 protease family protein [bacterium]